MSVPLPGLPVEGVQVCWLADAPEYAAALAAIHHAEWGELMPDWSRAEAEAELQDHAQRRAFPTTLVARHGEVLVGSVSLVARDAEQFDAYTPWLCSFWVDPAWRGRGVGTHLLTRICFAARRWGFHEVWLFTEGVTRLYERHGFRLHEQRMLFDRAVRILRLALA